MSDVAKRKLIDVTMRQTASWIELDAVLRLRDAALMREDWDEVNALTQRAHDILDAHMDLRQDVLIATRQLSD